MMCEINQIPHNSMKINANNIITFTVKTDNKMNQKSMSNLTRKQGSGVLSKRSMYEIENTLLNFFLHTKRENEKRKSESEEQNTAEHAAEKRGSTSAVQPFFAITEKKIMFATLTARHDSTTLESERKLFAAFRKLTKFLTAEFGIKYLWKVEKSSPEHQHFHIVFEDAKGIDIGTFWKKSCMKENIYAGYNFQTVSEFKLEEGNYVARYMSKQTDFEVDGKLFSMSNSMQVHRSKIVKNDKKAVQLTVENLEVITSNKRYTVFKKDE